jgi:hypothetical protein
MRTIMIILSTIVVATLCLGAAAITLAIAL